MPKNCYLSWELLTSGIFWLLLEPDVTKIDTQRCCVFIHFHFYIKKYHYLFIHYPQTGLWVISSFCCFQLCPVHMLSLFPWRTAGRVPLQFSLVPLGDWWVQIMETFKLTNRKEMQIVLCLVRNLKYFKVGVNFCQTQEWYISISVTVLGFLRRYSSLKIFHLALKIDAGSRWI